MAKEKLFYVGIKGLIQNLDKKFLLLKSDVRHKHAPGTQVYWDIPGGRVEEGASVIETLKREIQEETGIEEVENINFYTAVVSNHEIPLNENRKAGLVLMIYTVDIPAGSTITLSPEHTEYEWVEPAEAAKRLANKYPIEFTTKLM